MAVSKNKDLYVEGTFRIWMDSKGYLRMKFNQDPESLHYIPKSTKLYSELIEEFFTDHAGDHE